MKKDGSLKITNSYLNSAVNSLNSISTTKEGSSMLSLLQSSTNNFSITNTTFNPAGDKNQYTPNSMANAFFWEYMGKSNRDVILSTNRLSIGSGGTIYWSPTNELAGSLMTTNGLNFNPTTNLGHELFHGLDSNFGLLSRSKTDGLFDREWRATYFENQLRNSLGAPARSQYNTSNGPVNLLNNNTNPRPLIEYMINTFSIFNR
ncbi:M91 family zinc metallopeptidase [Empedobacter falsenii]